jgi:hypothetical protein
MQPGLPPTLTAIPHNYVGQLSYHLLKVPQEHCSMQRS